ncbi:rhodanese-like domain-containing protein [Streptomyces sp. NPDC059153]|uniref:rhodanese-like domain-containing protein n=1 Tax=Streptomyces sp. NPDC059153 TaxID=3346743 RepID=UPI0036C547FA
MSLLRRGPGRLSVTEAHRMLQEHAVVLLDVREADEWQAGHVPGARHLPMSRLTAGAGVPGAGGGPRLVLICRSGNRSRHAARLLAERGIDVVDVTGGMAAWARQGLPVQDARGAAGTVI